MFDALTSAEFESTLKEMGDDEKRHFREMLSILVRCYGKKPLYRAVLLYENEQEAAPIGVFSANCADMQATAIVNEAADFFNFMAMRDAPPKEQFN